MAPVQDAASVFANRAFLQVSADLVAFSTRAQMANQTILLQTKFVEFSKVTTSVTIF
jgi:hypothetical protein